MRSGGRDSQGGSAPGIDLRQADVQVGALFTDNRWLLVRSSAHRRSWLNVLSKNGFMCSVEDKLPIRVDPVVELTEIGQMLAESSCHCAAADMVARTEPEVLQG